MQFQRSAIDNDTFLTTRQMVIWRQHNNATLLYTKAFQMFIHLLFFFFFFLAMATNVKNQRKEKDTDELRFYPKSIE